MPRLVLFDVDGTLLILLHGNYASPRWWEPVRERLPGGTMALAPDMRRWVENGRTTIPDLADKLAMFADVHGLAASVIVGHSLGGMVATQFALDHPEMMQALVLIASGPPEGVPWGRFAIGRQLPWRWLRRWVMRSALGKAGLPSHHPLAEALIQDALATDPAVYAAFSRAVADWNVSKRLNELTTPTLLIWGENDPVMPLKIGWRLHGLIPCSRLVTLPGVGHSPLVETPEAVVEHLLRFLGERISTVAEPAGATQGGWSQRALDRLTAWIRG